MAEKIPSFEELLNMGIDVELTKENRLALAPSVEKIKISKDSKGTFFVYGASPDRKESIEIVRNDDNIMKMEHLVDGRKYSFENKVFQGRFTYQCSASKNPDTRHLNKDDEAKQTINKVGDILGKVKAQYNSKVSQTRSKTPTGYTGR